MSYTSPSPASRLREMLKGDSIVVAPGVYDGMSARYALNNGFKCLYMTGAGVAMSRTGWADLGLSTQTEMVDTARMIANIDRSVPLVADADTGYGAPSNVARTTQLYINAGVAGFHLEDQVVHKKCGHLQGKQCVPRDEYLARIRAAVIAREKVGSDIVIIARTDALQQLGLDEALGRLQDAIAAGADVAMLEAATQKHEMEACCKIFNAAKIPVLYGMVQGSKAYQMSPAEAEAMGVKVIIYATACIMPSYVAVNKDLQKLKNGDGQVYGPNQEASSKATIQEVFADHALEELLKIDEDSARPVK